MHANSAGRKKKMASSYRSWLDRIMFFGCLGKNEMKKKEKRKKKAARQSSKGDGDGEGKRREHFSSLFCAYEE